MTAGMSAALPVAPLYIHHRGGGSAVIAVFVGGPLIAAALAQIPAGHLADRYGRRMLLAISLTGYAALSLPLVIAGPSLWQLCLARSAQGLCVGSYQVAMRIALGDRSTAGNGAGALSRLQAATQVGVFAGPLIGGVLAILQDWLVFACGGLATAVCLVAVLTVHGLDAGSPSHPRPRFSPAANQSSPVASCNARRDWRRSQGFVLCCSALAANMLVINAYEITWPQYMSSRGYGPAITGVSIALYALPLAALSFWGGSLIGRVRIRVLLGTSFAVTGVCVGVYPALHGLSAILLINAVEAAATVAIQPALYAALIRSVPPSAAGRALGISGACEGGGGAVGAATLGALYGVSPGLPFWVSCGLLCCVGAACAVAVPTAPPVDRDSTTAAAWDAPEMLALYLSSTFTRIGRVLAQPGGTVAEWVVDAEELHGALSAAYAAEWVRHWQVFDERRQCLITIGSLETEVEHRRWIAEQRIRTSCRARTLTRCERVATSGH